MDNAKGEYSQPGGQKVVADLMTLSEVANYLRVTQKTIHRLLDKNAIPAMKVGHQWRFDKAKIDNWLYENSVGIRAKKAVVLVIDDDESICSLFKDILDSKGHTTITASESSRGLELVKANNCDLVFLDLKMPGVNGAELLKQIREVKPDLPVTIITGYPESDLMAEALTYGPFSIMSKPFRSSDVITAVENYLRFGKEIK